MNKMDKRCWVEKQARQVGGWAALTCFKWGCNLKYYHCGYKVMTREGHGSKCPTVVSFLMRLCRRAPLSSLCSSSSSTSIARFLPSSHLTIYTTTMSLLHTLVARGTTVLVEHSEGDALLKPGTYLEGALLRRRPPTVRANAQRPRSPSCPRSHQTTRSLPVSSVVRVIELTADVWQDRLIHYVSSDGVIYLVMADDSVGRRMPFAFLAELERRFTAQYAQDTIVAAGDHGLDEFEGELAKEGLESSGVYRALLALLLHTQARRDAANTHAAHEPVHYRPSRRPAQAGAERPEQCVSSSLPTPKVSISGAPRTHQISAAPPS